MQHWRSTNRRPDIGGPASRPRQPVTGKTGFLNGCKGLVLNGGTSDLLIVPARTSGEH